MTADRTLTRAEVTALATVALCLALLGITGLALAVDDRLLRGVSVWSKPAKFAFSFAVHLATLLLLVRLLTPAARQGWPCATALVGASFMTLVEVLYVALQASRGRASHYNTDTVFESVMYYGVMGGAAVGLVVLTALVGVLVLREARPEIGPGLRLGAGWGAILSALATLMVGGVLASGAVSGAGPWIGEPRTGVGGLPVVGWSRETGDLRVAHFVATHLMQAMAVAGLLADRVFRGVSLAPRLVVASVAGLGLALTAGTFLQALRGEPLWPAKVAGQGGCPQATRAAVAGAGVISSVPAPPERRPSDGSQRPVAG